jgi:Concanavalin A-like lectin/glucanases superfamily
MPVEYVIHFLWVSRNVRFSGVEELKMRRARPSELTKSRLTVNRTKVRAIALAVVGLSAGPVRGATPIYEWNFDGATPGVPNISAGGGNLAIQNSTNGSVVFNSSGGVTGGVNDGAIDGSAATNNQYGTADPAGITATNVTGGSALTGLPDQVNGGATPGTLNQFTISFWIKGTALGVNTANFPRLFILGTSGITDGTTTADNTNNNFEIEMRSGKLDVLANNQQSGTSNALGNVLNPNVWNFIAVTYDGTSTSAFASTVQQGLTGDAHNAQLYEGDNTLAPSTRFGVGDAKTTNFNDNTGPLNLGNSAVLMLGNRANLSRAFNGSIDDFRIYSSVLSPNDIEADRRQGAGLPPIVYGDGTWSSNGSGTWNTSDNTSWNTANVPNGTAFTANFGTFGGTINSPTTVNVNTAVTVGTINFDNTNSYTLNGSSITVGAINVLSGSHTINSQVVRGANPMIFNVVPATSTLTVPNYVGQNYVLNKNGAGTAAVNNVQNVTLVVNGGTLQMLPSTPATSSANVSKNIFFFAISPGAKLDLTNNGMIYTYGTSTTAPETIRGFLNTGYNGGNWMGSGINSSSAATIAATPSNIHKMAIAYADLADPEVQNTLPLSVVTYFGGASNAASILMRYTFAGDTNLDGTVDVNDFNEMALNYGTGTAASPQHWYEGDVNYDGTINLLDLNAIATNFGQTLPSSSPVALGALVPEPMSIGVLSFGAILAGRRTRRSR